MEKDEAGSAQPRRFFEVESLQDLASLLVGVTPAEIGRTASRLHYLYSPRVRGKRDGSSRQLFVPRDELKTLQSKIKVHILARVPLLPCVYGGVPGKSMKQMLERHAGKEVVFSTDIEKCFPSIHPVRVMQLFSALGFANPIAALLTKLTTWKGEIPQGSPTSPAIANLVLCRVDHRMMKLCEQHDFTYTRWVDDLYISGSYRTLKFHSLLKRIVEAEGFHLKAEKTEFMKRSGRQTALRMVVNNFPNLPAEKVAEIKKQLATESSQGELSASAKGKIYWLRHFNPKLGNGLLKKYANLLK